MTVHTTDCTPLSVCRCRPEIMSNTRFGAIDACRLGMLASSTFNECIKHTLSTELAAASAKMKRSMNCHHGNLICGDKADFVGSKVSPLVGSHIRAFSFNSASEQSTPSLLPFWQQVLRSPGDHLMPQLVVPSFIVPGE